MKRLETEPINKNPYYRSLQKRLQGTKELEQSLDEIRKFKLEALKDLKGPILKASFDLDKTMAELSCLADATLVTAYEIAREVLRKVYGMPRYKDNDGNYLPGDFALIGMGKLGGKEIHFGSDLDLIFIFNQNGETEGGRILTNQEFYAKLTQRIINYLTLHTRYGYLYKVDTELRPSGRAGTLVTPLDPWIAYYHENAALWEKQALLKARLIYASGDFSQAFPGLFKRLTFLTPFPETLAQEIHHLRMRIERELAREDPHRWNFKKGYGGIVEIEFTLQYLQLKLGKVFEDLLTPNTHETMAALKKRDIMPKTSLQIFKEAYDFYRKMEIYLEIHFNLQEDYLDPEHECVPQLAKLMNFSNEKEFLEAFKNYRREVRRVYLEVLKMKSEA